MKVPECQTCRDMAIRMRAQDAASQLRSSVCVRARRGCSLLAQPVPPVPQPTVVRAFEMPHFASRKKTADIHGKILFTGLLQRCMRGRSAKQLFADSCGLCFLLVLKSRLFPRCCHFLSLKSLLKSIREDLRFPFKEFH